MSKERKGLPNQLRFELEELTGNPRFGIPELVDSEVVRYVESLGRFGEAKSYETGLFADLMGDKLFRYNTGTFQKQIEKIQPASAAIILASGKTDPEGEKLTSYLLQLNGVLANGSPVYIFEERKIDSNTSIERKALKIDEEGEIPKGTIVVNAIVSGKIRNVHIYDLGKYFLFTGVYKQDEKKRFDVRRHPSVEAGKRATRIRAREHFKFVKLTWEELDARLADTDNPWEEIKLARQGRGSEWLEICGCIWRIDLEGREGVVTPCEEHEESWRNIQY
jgi:hypothetical protein